jgi:hypothetical protein
MVSRMEMEEEGEGDEWVIGRKKEGGRKRYT